MEFYTLLWHKPLRIVSTKSWVAFSSVSEVLLADSSLLSPPALELDENIRRPFFVERIFWKTVKLLGDDDPVA